MCRTMPMPRGASITDKCEYIVEQGVRGAMYWEYNCDNATHDLARTVARIVLGR